MLKILRRWLSQHQYAMNESVYLFRSSKFISLLTVLALSVLACVLTVIVHLYLGATPIINTMTSSIGRVDVYLIPGLPAEKISKIQANIYQIMPDAQITFLAKENLIKQFEGDPSIQQISQLLQNNPLPDMFELSTKKKPHEIVQQVQKIEVLAGVERVWYEREAKSKLYNLLQLSLNFLQTLLVIGLFIFVLLYFSILKLVQLQQRKRIMISLRLGATPRFIARVFYYQSAQFVVLICIFSSLWLGLTATLTAPFVSDLNQLMSTSHVQLITIETFYFCFAIVISGVWLGTFLSCRFFNLKKITLD